MTPNESSRSFFARNQFLIYRLFSLSGLIPVGAFLVVHLLTNASVLGGAASFQSRVDMIHGLGPLLVPVEWAFIFLPMLFHATVGFMIIGGGLPNVGSYPYVGNIRYTLQRATGMIAFAFIIWHVLQLHWMGEPLGGGEVRSAPRHQFGSRGGRSAGNLAALRDWCPLHGVPLRQRTLDPGDHLGAVDESPGDAAGELPEYRGRNAAGSRWTGGHRGAARH